MSNPLLEPIHGVSLYDYAAVSAKMASGISVAEICKKLGIEPAVFEEASALWITRMQEDGTFEVTTQFGQYFGEADNHPKLKDLQAEVSEEGQANLDKLQSDRYFYEELNGARQAAYEYGYDGAQWIQDNFGISLGDFQGVAMKWMEVQNQEMRGGNTDNVHHFVEYQQQKQREYAEKFAAEQGGNVGDDVEF
jgi:hypothetical protein